jgi:hypothetical protein
VLLGRRHFEGVEAAAAAAAAAVLVAGSGRRVPRVAEVRLEDCRIVPAVLSAEGSCTAAMTVVVAAAVRIGHVHPVRFAVRHPSCSLD